MLISTLVLTKPKNTTMQLYLNLRQLKLMTESIYNKAEEVDARDTVSFTSYNNILQKK